MIALFELAAYLLPLMLAIIGLCWLTNLLREKQHNIILHMRQHWRGTIVIVLTLVTLIFLLPFYANKLQNLATPTWSFWLQTVTGNWSPDKYPPLGSSAGTPLQGQTLNQFERYQFALSANIAFWLNNA